MRRWVVMGVGLPTVVATLLFAAGCSSQAPRRPAAVTAAPTPIEQLNTASMRLARVPFCSFVPTAAVREALDGPSTSSTSWRNGDRASVEQATPTDVVHENGCRWTRSTASSTASASAWMFARSVTPEEAADMSRAAADRSGCLTSSATFGNPSQRQACRLTGASRRVRVSGLFGSTWLSCEVVAPRAVAAPAVRARADAWCVQVANAVNQTR